MLNFDIFNALKGHFYAIYEDYGNFPIFKVCLILAIQKVF